MKMLCMSYLNSTNNSWQISKDSHINMRKKSDNDVSYTLLTTDVSDKYVSMIDKQIQLVPKTWHTYKQNRWVQICKRNRTARTASLNLRYNFNSK